MLNLDDKELFHLMHVMDLHDLGVKHFKEKDIMKLFLCRKCTDIIRITKEVKSCECGECSGYYEEDGLNAVFSGKNCVPLAIDNNALIKAVQMADIENKHQKQPTACKGVDFKSFVMLNCVESISKTK